MPTINTVRIIHHSSDVMEKEVLKEFFRYIGLLFYDAPISSAAGFAEEILEPRHKADIDIILNCNEELGWLPPEYLQRISSSTVVIQTQRLQKKRKFIISAKGLNIESEIYRNASNYYKELIANIIETVFSIKQKVAESEEDLESLDSAKKQMQDFLETIFSFELFIYMQYKRSFRVLNIGAVIDGLDVYPSISSGNDPSGIFNRKMLSALYDLYRRFEDKGSLKGRNYLLYAKANTMRKIKEITKLMRSDETSNPLVEEFHISFEDQMAIIYDIEISGKMHIGTLFLGATICHATDGQQSRAEDYYKQLIAFASLYPSNGIPVFYSFFYYQYGRYLDRFWNNEEYAAICYKKAAELDPRGYQARFMLGAFLVSQRRIVEAPLYLQDALRILYGRNNQARAFDCLSIKGIPYVFKANYLLAQLSANAGRIQECTYYLWGAEDAVDEFEKKVDRIKMDYCLEKDYALETNNENKIEKLFIQWNDAHRNGTPLRAMKMVLDVGNPMMVR